MGYHERSYQQPPTNSGQPHLEQIRGIPKWSIAGGNYDPEKPEAVPDANRLAAIRDSVRNYPDSAKIRLWARELVAYGIELSAIDFASNPTLGESEEHALNEDLSQAMRLENDPRLAREKAELKVSGVEDWPLILAVEAILGSDEVAQAEVYANTSGKLLDFSKLMVSIRYHKELSLI